ncbi:uncharacterized protein LOC143531308 [Bidens hawaiensis]|uniref:uncharacterized protein LOC143531308 n=1 Tax=Bidens hawaiensis TaxID=980011 RepID=UPI00404A7FD8
MVINHATKRGRPCVRGSVRGRGRKPRVEAERGDPAPQPEETPVLVEEGNPALDPTMRTAIADEVYQVLHSAIPEIVTEAVKAMEKSLLSKSSDKEGMSKEMPAREEEVFVPSGDEDEVRTFSASTRGCSYGDFNKCDPPPFDGTKGALETHQWVREMEAILRVSKCKGDDMVTFAIASLRSEALCWWDNLVQAMSNRSIRRMTWVELKKLVPDQFCPPRELDKIEQDFLTLEAGSMTHREYTMKFNKMARLCPDLVTPEAKRINKYVKGLPTDIRRGVMTTNMNSFHSVVTLAGTLYDQREKLPPTETRRTWNPNSYSKRPMGNNFNSAEKRVKIENSDFKMDVAFVKCKKCGKRHRGKCKHGSSSCFRCDKVGHPHFECPTLTCFRCKGAGHLASNCPTIKTGGGATGNLLEGEIGRKAKGQGEGLQYHQERGKR